MSYFGDNREHMNRLYDDIGYFFCKGGSISEFFHVLNYFFEDYDSKKEEENRKLEQNSDQDEKEDM